MAERSAYPDAYRENWTEDFLWKRRVPEVEDLGRDCGEGRRTVDHILRRYRTYNYVGEGYLEGG
jgi:hypothetical protein